MTFIVVAIFDAVVSSITPVQNNCISVQTLRNTILVSIFVGGSAFQYGFLFLNIPTTNDREKIRAVILSVLLFSSFLSWAGTIRYANHLAFSIGALDYRIKEIQLRDALEAERSMANIESGVERAEDSNGNEAARIVVAQSSCFPIHLFQPSDSQPCTVSEIVDSLNEQSVSMLSCFNLGFRFLFVSIPFAFYSVGPVALIITSAVMLVFLFDIDHVEKSTYSFMSGITKVRKDSYDP